jgi:hypothetical protein
LLLAEQCHDTNNRFLSDYNGWGIQQVIYKLQILVFIDLSIWIYDYIFTKQFMWTIHILCKN